MRVLVDKPFNFFFLLIDSTEVAVMIPQKIIAKI